MPATPRASRRSSATPPETPSPLKPRSHCHAASVQDRIREWQSNGASALDPDAVSVRSAPRSEAGNARSTTASPAPVTPQSATSRRGRLAQADGKDSRDGDRGKSTSSAPRRRLVSDQHWRANKAAGESTSSAAATATRPAKESIPTPYFDLSYTSNQRREERMARREQRRQSRLERQSQPLDGGRSDAKNNDSPPAATVDDQNSPVDQGLDRTPDRNRRSQSPPFEENGREPGSLHRPRTRPAHADSPARPDDSHEGLVKSRSKSKSATNVFFKTKEIFGRYEKPIPQRGPSIEAWLDQQPDPFVEDEVAGQGAPSSEARELPESPAQAEQPEQQGRPSGQRRRSKRRTSSRETPDPSTTRDSRSMAAPDETPASRPRDTSWTHGDEPLTQNGVSPRLGRPEGSPSTLRRGGRARRSRHQTSASHASPVNNHSDSQPEPLSPSPQYQQHPDRLCPPTGAHQLSTIASVVTLHGPGTDVPAPAPPPVPPHEVEPGLKRKLTTHEDLMSVLSLPMQKKSTRSRRRAQRQQQQQEQEQSQPSVSTEELLADLAADEEKYGRELRTLVDGVIPMLLQCVLSKSDAQAAAPGLLTSTTDDKAQVAFTKPIVDMGVALERLKSLHSRIPTHSADALLGWAHTAQKSYKAYLTAWRLGFQDVVVNLEPLEKGKEVERGMSRDADGDVVDSAGKKADVAYLLKRPLVRVRNLSNIFEAIKEISNRPLADEVAAAYADLTALARKRHQEEQGRLEDEAAARIDSTRARDVRTLAATTKASIDPRRRVRARDSFSLSMYHSTGQQLDCHIEMILRDNPADSPSGGDVLICEIDESGTWLLFPPIDLASISSRRAEDRSDLVVMIRGPAGLSREWHELLALTADDPDAVSEWMSMLGSSPLPPRLNRTRSFREPETRPAPSKPVSPGKPVGVGLPPAQRLTASALSARNADIDVPLGEPSVIGLQESGRPQQAARSNNPFERFLGLNLGGGLQPKPHPTWKKQEVPPERPRPARRVPSDRSTISDQSMHEVGRNVKAYSAPSTPRPGGAALRSPNKDHRPLHASKEQYMMSGALSDQDCRPHQSPNRKASENDRMLHQRHSSYPTKESHSAPTTPTVQKPESTWKAAGASPSTKPPGVTMRRSSYQEVSERRTHPPSASIQHKRTPPSGNESSGSMRRHRKHHSSSGSHMYTEDIPRLPGASLPQQSSPTKPLKPTPAPLTPRSSPKEERARNRRSSSPLKHEYAPSTASESSSDLDSDDSDDSSSDTSHGLVSEVKDVAMPLVAVTATGKRRSSKFGPPPSAPPTTGTRTLAPSDSASQGPYRKVPTSASVPATQKAKTIAMVCSWSNQGVWEQIHPDECSIVISPGLIEAFQMSPDHSGAVKGTAKASPSDDSDTSREPLVAFELTPIVPLRRGTALDINIRSPPTASSRLKTTNNIMFRSRNADECDSLYSMINWARCNNPTYIELQRARSQAAAVTFNTGRGEQKKSGSRGWLGLGGLDRRSSYRAAARPAAAAAAAARPPSAGGDSEASAGGLSSAFLALKRFGVSSAFNLNRSSVTWQAGRRTSASLYSSESGTLAGGGSGTSTPLPSQLGYIPGKDGPNVPGTSAEAADGGGMINNMKIRLYVRKGQHWEDQGAGRLTVMPAEDGVAVNRAGTSAGGDTSGPVSRPASVGEATPPPRGPQLPSANHTPNRLHGHGKEKRIIVRKAKDDSVVLLDVTLGESCFERVMQTGIAVKVWDEYETIADKGGVVMSHGRVYMMQFPGTREAGWVFGLCGTYRYGTE